MFPDDTTIVVIATIRRMQSIIGGDTSKTAVDHA